MSCVRLLNRLMALNMTISPLVVDNVYHQNIMCFKGALKGFLLIMLKIGLIL